MSGQAVLLDALVRGHWPSADGFFERVKTELAEPCGLGFRAAFASVPRRLGALAQANVEPPAELLGTLSRPHWTLTDYARAALLAQSFAVAPSLDQAGSLLQLFESGEIGEQVSLLRTLSLWDAPEGFLETALQACRTNAKLVFEAIACENAFPAAHFPALSFNQLVLKAIFMEVSARRIEGLEKRITPELRRMAAGYASERRAAGRSVPIDTDYLVNYGV
mgnify:CR=1 FL=1